MILQVAALKKGEGQFLVYNAEVLLSSLGAGFSDGEHSPFKISLEAAYLSGRVIIKGTWEVHIVGECSRCLEETPYTVKENFYEEFTHLQGCGEPGEGLAREDVKEGDIFTFKGDLLNLAEYLRQSLLMAQPLKVLCRDECKGLCVVCGKNKNKEQCECTEASIDPRWAMLQEIKKKG